MKEILNVLEVSHERDLLCVTYKTLDEKTYIAVLEKKENEWVLIDDILCDLVPIRFPLQMKEKVEIKTVTKEQLENPIKEKSAIRESLLTHNKVRLFTHF